MANKNFQKAESAIKLLKDGITNNNKTKILASYNALEKDSEFNWNDLDVLYLEWESLLDESNEILYTE